MAEFENTEFESKDWGVIGMTIEECATALRINPRTLREMIRDRPDFPARRMGGKAWRIDPDAVRRWLDGHDGAGMGKSGVF